MLLSKWCPSTKLVSHIFNMNPHKLWAQCLVDCGLWEQMSPIFSEIPECRGIQHSQQSVLFVIDQKQRTKEPFFFTLILCMHVQCISIFWPFRPALGPSGLLDFVLHALRPPRPCDPRNSAMQLDSVLVCGQCVNYPQANTLTNG